MRSPGHRPVTVGSQELARPHEGQALPLRRSGLAVRPATERPRVPGGCHASECCWGAVFRIFCPTLQTRLFGSDPSTLGLELRCSETERA